jgi:saccharopine dehydrogenase-like NADP-dependent oxidoreductase
MLTGKWAGKGIFNVEQFDPDLFLKSLSKRDSRQTLRR